jgi:hypothetical protein
MLKDNLEICSEGGEGIVIPSVKPQENTLYTRCSCIDCKAQSCKRLVSFLEEINNPPKEAIVAKFCGDVLLDPEKDCNYFL